MDKKCDSKTSRFIKAMRDNRYLLWAILCAVVALLNTGTWREVFEVMMCCMLIVDFLENRI